MAVDSLAYPPASHPLKKGDFSTGKSAEDRRLKKACADFEGILIQFMFQDMEHSVGDGGIFGKSFRKQMYDSMFIQKVSTTLAETRGLGLAKELYRQETGSTAKAASSPGTGHQNQNDSKEIKALNRYKL